MRTNSRHSWRLHLGLFVAEVMCVSAFLIEISRALSGNTLSWAYVVEWPILGAYAIYMWRKLLREEGLTAPEPSASDPIEDLKLAQWNEYLVQVHQHDQSNPPK
jgi:hypothetical protein